MNRRWLTWITIALLLCLLIAAIFLPILKRRVRQAAQLQQKTEEQSRRELTQSLIANPGEPHVKAQLFWLSGAEDSMLAPVTVELPLSSDPILRAKQVLNTLLGGPVNAELRTLPPDAVLLAFYLLPDGTAIADFSEALATSTPSGIESEQAAVDSITETLEANVPQVRRLKLLIHGQEVDTLAGHVDLTGFFIVNAKPAPVPPATKTPAPRPAGNAPANIPKPLTQQKPPVTLAQPGHTP
ncbi:MAG TPA: GerMN domain-containing protein [Candidatus Acidoferrum sp.]|jgi:hypothetical protein